MSINFDWTGTFHKISTWLGILSAAAGAGLVAYAAMPDKVQSLMPDIALTVLGAASILPALAVGAATAYKQSGFGNRNAVEIKTVTTVKGDLPQEKAVELARAVSVTQETTNVEQTERPAEPS